MQDTLFPKMYIPPMQLFWQTFQNVMYRLLVILSLVVLVTEPAAWRGRGALVCKLALAAPAAAGEIPVLAVRHHH